MALTWDIGRLRAAKTRLSNAAEAGCAAYVNLVDADSWIFTKGAPKFAPNAATTALSVFYASAPPGSILFISPRIGPGNLMKAQCTATTTVRPFIDLGLGDYHATVFADAKAEWISNPFK